MSTPTCHAAYVRGGLVGVCSAAFVAAAHGLAGGELPSSGSLTVLALAYVVLGAVAGSVRIDSRPKHVAFLALALCGCQFFGHVVLAVSSGHCHEMLAFSPQMLVAHGAAAAVCARVISLVEHLYAVCSTVLAWLTVFAVGADRPTHSALPGRANPVVLRQLLLGCGPGTRGPPALSLS